MTTDIDNATRFLFDETYQMWRSDLEKIFRIGTRNTNGGCNLSSCILVLIGIESFSRFFSKKKSDKHAFEDFFKCYYPDQYHGRMKHIYELFRNGLAHYYYPKSKTKYISSIKFVVNRTDKRVLSLTSFKKKLDFYRSMCIQLVPDVSRPIILVPQVLFLDTVNVMEYLREQIKDDGDLQKLIVEKYLEINKELFMDIESNKVKKQQ